jgi:hypothetical protein
MLQSMKTILLNCVLLNRYWLKIKFALTCLLLAMPAFAQTFEGNNGSSELIRVVLGSNGFAQIYWHPNHLGGQVAIRETWQSSPDNNGFRLIAPSNSLLKKSGDSMIYVRISASTSSVHCTQGCATAMPNLMGLQR